MDVHEGVQLGVTFAPGLIAVIYNNLLDRGIDKDGIEPSFVALSERCVAISPLIYVRGIRVAFTYDFKPLLPTRRSYPSSKLVEVITRPYIVD